MQERRQGRRLLAPACLLLVVGVLLTWSGVASAAARPNATVVLRISAANDDATLQLPQVACPGLHPGCQWTLEVWEVYGPGEVLVGKATGSTGVLTAGYPSDYCGEIQADALIDLIHWRVVVGHRQEVGSSGSGCTSPNVPTEVPFTGVANPTGGNGSSVPTGGAPQLPFTGVDIRPLALIGSALVAIGLLMVDPFRRRRRTTLAWAGGTASHHPARTRRVAWWLLGE